MAFPRVDGDPAVERGLPPSGHEWAVDLADVVRAVAFGEPVDEGAGLGDGDVDGDPVAGDVGDVCEGEGVDGAGRLGDVERRECGVEEFAERES